MVAVPAARANKSFPSFLIKSLSLDNNVKGSLIGLPFFIIVNLGSILLPIENIYVISGNANEYCANLSKSAILFSTSS